MPPTLMPEQTELLTEPTLSGLSEKARQSLRHNRNFLFLWASQVASQLGDRVVFVVFVSLIVHHYGTNESYTSLLYIAFTIPAVLLTAIAGVFVDRWPKKVTLVTTNLLRAGLVCLIPAAATGSLWALYGVAFLLSAVTQFFVPAEAATIPTIVPKQHLVPANSIFTTTMMASIIFGFALGDPLINALGLKQVHWALVGLFLIAALVLTGLKIPQTALKVAQLENALQASTEPTQPTTLKATFAAFWAELKDGLRYIKQTPVVWQAMLKLSLLFSTIVATCILSISFSKAFLYTNPEVAARKFAYIVAVSGVGMALGALLVGKPFRHARRPWLVFGGMVAVGTALAALMGVTWVSADLGRLWFSLPAWHLGPLMIEALPLTVRMAYTYGWVTLLGVGATFISIPLQSLLHEQIPEDKRGKVLGVQFTLLSTSSTLPAVVAGVGADVIGVKPMLAMMALPFLVWGSWGLLQQAMCHKNTGKPSLW